MKEQTKNHSVSLYCRQLVEMIERKRGQKLTPAVREAFLRVPRHQFVPFYYDGNELKSSPAPCDEEEWHRWLANIYRDEALVTQQDKRGLPTSSSSQPSVMATMLEYLAVKPGQRVLEIGTGTGYNAALLAMLTGNPSLVTTIDVDSTQVNLARPRIEQVVGKGMNIAVANGMDGYARNAPYDRIIATGSTVPVPPAWVTQLNSGGKIVMDMRGYLDGGLMVIEKQEDGFASGQFVTEWPMIRFMRLRSSVDEAVSVSSLKGYQRLPVVETAEISSQDAAWHCAVHFAAFEQFRAQDDELNLWLQWLFPALSVRWKTMKNAPETLCAVLSDETSRTVAIIERREQKIVVTVHGERPLWSDIVQAYEDWLQAGKPGRESYTLHIESAGQQVMSMNYQGITRDFLLAAL